MWKWLGRNGTTTNRRGVERSTTFCVFHLTGNLHPLILRFQIRGTWMRQTDRVGDESRSVGPRNGPGSKRKKPSAKYQLRARILGGAAAVRLSAKHRPAAGHWRFALELKFDRSAVGFFSPPAFTIRSDQSCV